MCMSVMCLRRTDCVYRLKCWNHKKISRNESETNYLHSIKLSASELLSLALKINNPNYYLLCALVASHLKLSENTIISKTIMRI